MSDSAQPKSTGVFDFFALPAELRDAVYGDPALIDAYHCNRIERRFEHRILIYRHLPSLRLISQQFSAEYLKRCCKETLVYMQDLDLADRDPFRLPSKVKTATELELRLVINCIGEPNAWNRAFEYEVISHDIRLATFMASMRGLRSVRIKAYLRKSDKIDRWYQVFVDLMQELGSLIRLPKVQSLEIFQAEDTSTYAYVRGAKALGVWKDRDRGVTKIGEEDAYVDYDGGMGLGSEYDYPGTYKDGENYQDSDASDASDDDAAEDGEDYVGAEAHGRDVVDGYPMASGALNYSEFDSGEALGDDLNSDEEERAGEETVGVAPDDAESDDGYEADADD